MSRVTAPVSKLTRAISSAPSAAARSSSPLLDSTAHHHGASSVALMPKYAELLRNRSSEHTDSSRGLTTNARPSAQPSIANRPRPLMQTFHSSASRSAVPISTNLDAMVLPDLGSISAAFDASEPHRMPLLPDNYGAAHVADAEDSVKMPSIIAADPDKVSPATPLSTVEGSNLDGIELKFAHESPATGAQADEQSHMLRDLWKGMVEDVLGPARKSA